MVKAKATAIKGDEGEFELFPSFHLAISQLGWLLWTPLVILQAENIVLAYLKQQNRPYNSTDISSARPDLVSRIHPC